MYYLLSEFYNYVHHHRTVYKGVTYNILTTNLKVRERICTGICNARKVIIFLEYSALNPAGQYSCSGVRYILTCLLFQLAKVNWAYLLNELCTDKFARKLVICAEILS